MQFNNKKFGSKLDAIGGDLYSFFGFGDEPLPKDEDLFNMEGGYQTYGRSMMYDSHMKDDT